jgi:hypothetical protein
MNWAMLLSSGSILSTKCWNVKRKLVNISCCDEGFNFNEYEVNQVQRTLTFYFFKVILNNNNSLSIT